MKRIIFMPKIGKRNITMIKEWIKPDKILFVEVPGLIQVTVIDVEETAEKSSSSNDEIEKKIQDLIYCGSLGVVEGDMTPMHIGVGSAHRWDGARCLVNHPDGKQCVRRDGSWGKE